jgi:hypothetical protein
VRIWVENKVDFSKNVNMMVGAVTMIIGIANFTFSIAGVSFNGIAIGSIAVLVMYHGLTAIGHATGSLPKDEAPAVPEAGDKDAISSK